MGKRKIFIPLLMSALLLAGCLHGETLPDGTRSAGQDGAGDTRTGQPFMAVKTNLLYDAALVPNIGAEFALGRRWSIAADWMYAWWRKDSRHRYLRVYGGGLELRRYFGRRAAERTLQGHHIGLYAMGLTYDVEWGATGYLSKFTYGAGIEYGYSLPIAGRLNLDFGLGLGYAGGKYKIYEPEDGCYVYRKTRQRRWFGPTKAEISLVWLLGHGGNNSTKGGTR